MFAPAALPYGWSDIRPLLNARTITNRAGHFFKAAKGMGAMKPKPKSINPPCGPCIVHAAACCAAIIIGRAQAALIGSFVRKEAGLAPVF